MSWFLFDYEELKRLQGEHNVDTDNLVLSDLKIRYQWLVGNIDEENCNSLLDSLDPDNLDVGFRKLSDAEERLGGGFGCQRRIWAMPTVCLSFRSTAKPETKYYLNICPSKYSEIFWLSELRFCQASGQCDFSLVSENGCQLKLSEEPFFFKPPSYEKVFDFFDSNWEHPRIYTQSMEPLTELPTFDSLPLRQNLKGACISYLGAREAPESVFFRGYSFDNEKILAEKLERFFGNCRS